MLPDLVRYAGDQWTHSIDFANRLPSGAAVASVEVKAYDMEGWKDVSSDILGATATTTTTISVLLKALTPRYKRKKYSISYKATLDNSNVLIETQVMRVKV